MKYLQINSFGNFSTGKIACDLARECYKNGDECYVAYARGTITNDVKFIKIGNTLNYLIHCILARFTDKAGFYSKSATKKFLKWVDEYNPDVIHLHNLHGYYINVEMLFNYLKEHSSIKVEWTLHDCWAFTGHCAYYSFNQCSFWMTGCKKCSFKKSYPRTIFSNSKKNFQLKKSLFTSIEKNKLTIITPSYWLKSEVGKSFLSKYQIIVQENKIDKTIFFKNNTSYLKEKYNIIANKIYVSVASTWDKRKGLDILLKLSKYLTYEELIVIVGLSKKQI